MKLFVISIATLILIAVALISETSHAVASVTQQAAKESKEQPKKVTLDADSLDDKWGAVAFDHETHSLKNYNPDGKSVTSCVECHHTDQPKENLKAPLVTSEKAAVSTAAALKEAPAPPEKTGS